MNLTGFIDAVNVQEYYFREAPKNLFGARFIPCAEISKDNGRESEETRRRDANRLVRASVALASSQMFILPNDTQESCVSARES